MEKQVKIRVANTQYDIIKLVAKEIMGWELNDDQNSEDWDICWQDYAVSIEQFSNLKPLQKINHFPGMFALARKNKLALNLQQMKIFFENDYNFFPNTWLLPRDNNDLKNKCKNKTLIVKPEASSQGKGIFLTKSIDGIPEKCVVQEYISNPFLIENLKFDLRIYVLVLGCDPLRIYIYEEGLVRFATEDYIDPLNSIDKVCMHLTNYAINKNNPKFITGNGDEGHKRSISWLFGFLEDAGHNTEILWNDIKDIVIKTLISAHPYLSYIYRLSHPHDISNSMCFELLGFDILIDSNLKPWLLEVNHTPSFKTETPIDELVKRMVILDTFNLIGKPPSDNERNALLMHTKTMLKSLSFNEMKKWRKNEENRSQKLREKIEQEIEGGYQKIFPNDCSDYERFIMGARRAWSKNYSSLKKTEKIVEEEKKPIKKKISFPKLRKAFFDPPKITPIKIRQITPKPSMMTISFYKPAPKFSQVNTYNIPKKRRANSGNFVKPKMVEYEGEMAKEESKSYMRMKIISYYL